jgi:hypothetical protein
MLYMFNIGSGRKLIMEFPLAISSLNIGIMLESLSLTYADTLCFVDVIIST